MEQRQPWRRRLQRRSGGTDAACRAAHAIFRRCERGSGTVEAKAAARGPVPKQLWKAAHSRWRGALGVAGDGMGRPAVAPAMEAPSERRLREVYRLLKSTSQHGDEINNVRIAAFY